MPSDLAYEDAREQDQAERDEQATVQVEREIAAVKAAEACYNALVANEMCEIIEQEGRWHVAGRYFADEDDADRQRQLEAERRVSNRLRAQSWEERQGRVAA